VRLDAAILEEQPLHEIPADPARAAMLIGARELGIDAFNWTRDARQLQARMEFVRQHAPAAAGPWPAVDDASLAASFDEWLDYAVRMDREARACEVLAVASIILADMDHTLAMARRVEQAGIRVMELNIGTPYAREAKANTVTTAPTPARVGEIVATVRKAVSIPIWVKTTGQSERVPDLAEAAFRAGADSVIMAGRLLGLIPDVDTMKPMLDTALGIGGYWNLPMTCYWLAVSRSHHASHAGRSIAPYQVARSRRSVPGFPGRRPPMGL